MAGLGVGRSCFGGLFEGRKVLVTGNTGFKGAWLTLWLLELGAHVVGYSLPPPTKPSLFEAARLAQHVHQFFSDVRDLACLIGVFQKVQPEFVFHLAAQSLVLESYARPVDTYATNVLGTVNVLEATRMTPSVRVCIIVTSDKCYENVGSDKGYQEGDRLGGDDPYSSSKACAELVVSAYRRSYFAEGGPDSRSLGLATVRAGNVIGGGDWAEHRIMPDIVRALSTGKAVTVRNPHAIRPWQYVLEPLAGYLWLAACLWRDPSRYSGPWNFGPGDGGFASVQDLVESAIRQWGGGMWVVSQDSNSNQPRREAHILRLDSTRAVKLLGWASVFGFDEMLYHTVNWYKEYLAAQEGDHFWRCIEYLQTYTAAAHAANVSWCRTGGDTLV